MEYVSAGVSDQVVYLGVKVYIKDSVVHTTVHDRESEYPFHIVCYPESSSAVPQQQLGGVVMGRLVHCQAVCSYVADFKESCAAVFRNAIWRGYSRRLVQSVWSRFLFQRWHSDIRWKELRTWFSKLWNYLMASGTHADPLKAYNSISSTNALHVFGVSLSCVHPSTAMQVDNTADRGFKHGDGGGSGGVVPHAEEGDAHFDNDEGSNYDGNDGDGVGSTQPSAVTTDYNYCDLHRMCLQKEGRLTYSNHLWQRLMHYHLLL